mgnify:FL=1
MIEPHIKVKLIVDEETKRVVLVFEDFETLQESRDFCSFLADYMNITIVDDNIKPTRTLH